MKPEGGTKFSGRRVTPAATAKGQTVVKSVSDVAGEAQNTFGKKTSPEVLDFGEADRETKRAVITRGVGGVFACICWREDCSTSHPSSGHKSEDAGWHRKTVPGQSA